MLQALNTGHEGSLVTRARQLRRRRDPPARDARDDERPAAAVRGAARPDQQRDRRDRADRPLRGRRAAGSPRSRSSRRTGARRFRLAPVATFEADPIGPDRRVTGRFAPRAPAGAGRAPADARRRGGAAAEFGERAEIAAGAEGGRLMDRDAPGAAAARRRAAARADRLAIVRQRRRAARRAGLARRARRRRGARCGGSLHAARRAAAADRSAAGACDLAVERRRRRSGRPSSCSACAAATLACLYPARTLFMPRLMALVVAVGLHRRRRARLGRAAPRPAPRPVRRAAPDVARLLANGASAGLSLPAAIQLAARELEDPAGDRDAHGDRGAARRPAGRRGARGDARRLPSRELGVLMTTLVIQQRAGGDTVRALNELGHTLEARKDLMREIRTLLSGSVFTSLRWWSGSASRRSCCST